MTAITIKLDILYAACSPEIGVDSYCRDTASMKLSTTSAMKSDSAC